MAVHVSLAAQVDASNEGTNVARPRRDRRGRLPLSTTIRAARVLASEVMDMEAIHEFEWADFTVTVAVDSRGRFVHRFNRKTAKALGLAIPQSVLLRADEVIE